MEKVALLRLICSTGCTTCTLHVALCLPTEIVTVAVPRPAVVTEPSWPTVATALSLLDQVCASVQLAGSTLAVSLAVCRPLSSTTEVLLSVTLVAWKRFCTKVKPCAEAYSGATDSGSPRMVRPAMSS